MKSRSAVGDTRSKASTALATSAPRNDKRLSVKKPELPMYLSSIGQCATTLSFLPHVMQVTIDSYHWAARWL
jgi:hypothetical protein